MGKKINETASAGSMGSGSIARAPSGGYENVPLRLRDFMQDFFKRTKSRLNYHPVNLGEAKSYKRLDESSRDLNGIFSELKSTEKKGVQGENTVTYGVEDDNNNLMKVTVPSDQAEEFEEVLSQQMAEVEDFKATGSEGKNMSMAELLYNLKDEFNIIDVEFPTIPKDMVYNADQATEAVDEPDMDMDDDENFDDSEFDDSESGENFGDEESELGDDDDDSIEDFDDSMGDEESDTESLLKSVMQTFKAQAETEKAKHEAEAEKARAIQAKYSQQAAHAELEKQEEMVKIEAEMDAQKQKEKEAKKIADIAKHNYSKSKGSSAFGEGFNFSSLMQSAIVEVDEFESMNLLRRQKANLRIKYASQPEDSPELRRHKQEQLRHATNELNAKIRAVQSRDRFEKQNQDREENEDNQENRDANQNRGEEV